MGTPHESCWKYASARAGSRRHPPNGVSAKAGAAAQARSVSAARSTAAPLEPERRRVRHVRRRAAREATVGGVEHVADGQAVADREDRRLRPAEQAPRAPRRSAPRPRRASRRPPGTAASGVLLHAQARYSSSGPPSNEPNPISSRAARPRAGVPARERQRERLARAPQARADAERRSAPAARRSSERSCLLDSLRREPLARRDAVDDVLCVRQSSARAARGSACSQEHGAVVEHVLHPDRLVEPDRRGVLGPDEEADGRRARRAGAGSGRAAPDRRSPAGAPAGSVHTCCSWTALGVQADASALNRITPSSTQSHERPSSIWVRVRQRKPSGSRRSGSTPSSSWWAAAHDGDEQRRGRRRSRRAGRFRPPAAAR